MSDDKQGLRRIPIALPGRNIILVVKGEFSSGVDEEGIVQENVPVSAIVAVEECPDDVTPVAIVLGSQDGVPSSDPEGSDPPDP